jgi:hypothetical protein
LSLSRLADNGGSNAILSSVVVGHVVSLSGEVDETGVLALSFETLNLEAARSGYNKEIACFLVRKALEDIIRT